MLFVVSSSLRVSSYSISVSPRTPRRLPPAYATTRLLGLLLLLHLPELSLLVQLLYPLSFLFAQISPLCLLLCCLLLFGSLLDGGVLALSDLEVLLQVEIDSLSGADQFTRDLIVSLYRVKGGERTSGFKRFCLSMRSTMLRAT